MKHNLRKILVAVAMVGFVFAVPSLQAQEEVPQVMLLGMFHFSNPGSDSVKIDKQINVMDEASQAYLQVLSARIATEFRPTKVLLEYNPENDDVMQERYQQYLSGEYELGVNEIYQVGFRVAKMAGGVPIASFDEQEVHWDAAPLFEVIDTIAPDIGKQFEQEIAAFTEEGKANHQTMNLNQLLRLTNDPEKDRRNKDLYIMTNSVGVGDKFEGALASSSWWHRNFRMYAKIQTHAKPGERILAIGGQGHTAILKDFLAIDARIESVDVHPMLED